MTHISRKVGVLLSAAAFPAMLAIPMASAEAGGYHHRSYSYHHYGRSYHHRHHGNGLAVGVLGGIIGLAVGSAIANNNDRGPDRVVVRERVVTAPPTWRDPDVYGRDYGYSDYGSDNGWYQPVPVSQRQPAANEPASTCLQTREYQTHITVGGKDVEAYGTACLQPDGSWKFGAPTPEPQ